MPWPLMWWKATARDENNNVGTAYGPTRRTAERAAGVELKQIVKSKATFRTTRR